MSIIGFYNETEQTTAEIGSTKSGNLRNRRNFAKTISIKKFISDFGLFFSGKMQERLMELELRTVLTRVENTNILNIKHVEHLKHPCLEDADGISEKEFIFGQLVAIEGELYFTSDCDANENTIKCDSVDKIYSSLGDTEHILSTGSKVKKIDEGNVDAFVNGLLQCIPEVSERYLSILKKMTSYEK